MRLLRQGGCRGGRLGERCTEVGVTGERRERTLWACWIEGVIVMGSRGVQRCTPQQGRECRVRGVV